MMSRNYHRPRGSRRHSGCGNGARGLRLTHGSHTSHTHTRHAQPKQAAASTPAATLPRRRRCVSALGQRIGGREEGVVAGHCCPEEGRWVGASEGRMAVGHAVAALISLVSVRPNTQLVERMQQRPRNPRAVGRMWHGHRRPDTGPRDVRHDTAPSGANAQARSGSASDPGTVCSALPRPDTRRRHQHAWTLVPAGA